MVIIITRRVPSTSTTTTTTIPTGAATEQYEYLGILIIFFFFLGSCPALMGLARPCPVRGCGGSAGDGGSYSIDQFCHLRQRPTPSALPTTTATGSFSVPAYYHYHSWLLPDARSTFACGVRQHDGRGLLGCGDQSLDARQDATANVIANSHLPTGRARDTAGGILLSSSSSNCNNSNNNSRSGAPRGLAQFIRGICPTRDSGDCGSGHLLRGVRSAQATLDDTG